MRSKSKARKVAHDDSDEPDNHRGPLEIDTVDSAASPRDDPSPTLTTHGNNDDNMGLHNIDELNTGPSESSLSKGLRDADRRRDMDTTRGDQRGQPSTLVAEECDNTIPEELELERSAALAGLGVRSRTLIPYGKTYGPFRGKITDSVDNPEYAWEIFDDSGKLKHWIDASEPGSGNWMKYIRSARNGVNHNLEAVQIEDQIYYRTLKDIQAGEEMLLFNKDLLYPDSDCQKSDEEVSPYGSKASEELLKAGLSVQNHHSFMRNEEMLSRTLSQDNSDRSEGEESRSGEFDYPIESGLEGEYKCDECPQSFQWKSNLLRHQAAHEASRRFPCENCDKIFTDPSNLQRHIRSQHHGARSHACSECGKTFATSSGLKQHQHIHSSVKPFQCEVCLKAYTQFSNLCRHKRMHADCRQQIKCKDCGQAFSTVTSLSKHKRFCEGALRSGMRLGFSPDKMSPLGNVGMPPTNQASPLTAAAYMGLYGARPAYPFYPGMGTGYPIFPGHPLGPLGSPMSPVEGKFQSALSPEIKTPTSIASDIINEKKEIRMFKDRKGSEGSEGSELSDMTSGSDLDISSGSDAESEASVPKKPVIRPTPSFAMKPKMEAEKCKPVEIVKPSPVSINHPLPVNRQRQSPVAAHNTVRRALILPMDQTDLPFDLSKAKKSSASGSGEQPLDLSNKIKEPVPLKKEPPRKTHVFGERRLSPPESKLHYAYPMMNPLLLDSIYGGLDKDKLQSYHEAAKFMAFARFPMTSMASPTFAPMAQMTMMPHQQMDHKTLSPIMKLDKTPEHLRFHPNLNKLKERYSCKYCGKIFPRSANLTRHLRTHTGEQPYKCKYCERSFSISSNLQRHVRNIHNKEKPFKCPLCDRCFGQQTNLDRHLKKHEAEGPNVTDSPFNEAQGLDEKDEAYFAEIRNFIGKSTSETGKRNGLNTVKTEEQCEENSRKRSFTEEHMSEANDDVDDDLPVNGIYSRDNSDDDDDSLNEPLSKKCRSDEEDPVATNNNIDNSDKPQFPRLSNGFLSPEKDSDCVQKLCQKKSYEIKNGFTALTCST